MKYLKLDHQFVEYIPERLEAGTLYISMRYATAVHLCCCGCGSEVVTPLTPTDWSMVFNGENVSLHPSVGNWNLPCRSHYIINSGNVISADPWSAKMVQSTWERDRYVKANFYGKNAQKNPAPQEEVKIKKIGWLSRLGKIFHS